MNRANHKLMASQDIDDEIVLRANYVFGCLNPPVKCSNIDDIQVSHFIKVYHLLTGEEIPGSKCMTTKRAKLTICQFMLYSIADDIVQMPLDHITANGVIDKDRRVLKDLLDIFIQLIEASESDLDDESSVSGSNDDSRVVPTHIREALRDIEFSASQMVGKISQIHQMSYSQLSQKQAKFTQTTPAQMTSSTTSPVTWNKLLSNYKNKDNQDSLNINDEKSKRLWASERIRRPLGSVSNLPTSHTTVGKQKHVVSTKLKKAFPTSPLRQENVSTLKTRRLPMQTSKRNAADNANIRKALSLVGELEKVRNRRKEITQQISQLQSEDQSLKTLESIMVKELKLSQFMQSRDTKKIRQVTGKPRTATLKKRTGMRT